ncbi:outer dynein arm-docking complex subunit 3-like [Corythoichthys intestinalis]|uniref:outer dynein arm-docking complex subunit 3-like n=1 Tax=Corythoichthys intestinalis TaxID=161448 RepID=UPI0025A5BC8F|nr:outer dynein arm-docking complex subunit 3-like [Corythoichthys intestinalis]XP_061791375.1 outer dynein arm-docking complex subunit 3-like [Nerophis lumbriciformis]
MFESESVKPSVYDQIADLQRKLQLLESDRSAYYESSHSTLEKNRQNIQQLRGENRDLQRRVSDAEADEHQFIKLALHGRSSEKNTWPIISEKAALSKLQHRVASKTKRLNALRHSTLTHEQRLEDLKRECVRLEALGYIQAISEKEDITMKLRSLQNSLEKNQLKCKEAANIMTNYLKLKRHLQEESLTFEGKIDEIQTEITKYRKELHEVQDMNNKAQLSKEMAITELQQEEELFFKEHREKDYILAVYRKRVQEIKARAEKLDAQRKSVPHDDLNTEVEIGAAKMAAEMAHSIRLFSTTLQCVKEATGYTATEGLLNRYIAQRETHQHLQALKAENQSILLQLKEQKVHLQEEFEDIKYSGETQLSSEQRMLDECEKDLLNKQQSCETAKERHASLVKILGSIQAGVEHLAERLNQVSLNEPPSKVSPKSKDFLVHMLTQCEQKVQLLQGKLEGKDLEEITKDMEEEEFFFMVEKQLPTYNKRVTMSEDQEMSVLSNEDDNEEEEGILSREAMKRRSQTIVDMCSKKTWKIKKGK